MPHDTTPQPKEPLQWYVTAIDDSFTMAMQCKPSKNLEVVEMSQVQRKCVLVQYGAEVFTSAIPNFVESD